MNSNIYFISFHLIPIFIPSYISCDNLWARPHDNNNNNNEFEQIQQQQIMKKNISSKFRMKKFS